MALGCAFGALRRRPLAYKAFSNAEEIPQPFSENQFNVSNSSATFSHATSERLAQGPKRDSV